MRFHAHCGSILKRSMALLLALVIALPSFADKGDVNSDGSVNVSDVTALINSILGVQSIDQSLADVNGDGAVNVSDVTYLINLILGVIVDDDPNLKLVGGDVSMLTKYEQKGSIYYDKNGTRINDVLAFYKQQGLNALRVRLFVKPANATAAQVGEGVVQDLPYVTALGKRIKDAGFKFVLDLHYSDSWADPGKQTLPADWAGLTVDQLEQKVEDYTREVLLTLVSAGARPDLVQVGNEITYGMLWPTGHCWPSGADYDGGGSWTNFARYFNAGSRAVREVCPNARVIAHVEMSRYTNATSFFAQAVAHELDFDVMGLSYYPSYHASTGTIFGALTTVLSTLSNAYPDVPIMIMETGYGYAWNLPDTKYNFTTDYPYSEAGQAKYAKDLVTVLNTRPNVKGLFWWWPEANEYGNSSYQVTTNWWNGSLVDNRNGRMQQALYELPNFK